MTTDASKFLKGNSVTLTGLVSEDYASEGLTRTSLREIDMSTLTSVTGGTLPARIKIGSSANGADRIPPDGKYSSFTGNLNLRPQLDVADGIDFWETLEGMRCTILSADCVGAKGGMTTKNDNKSYITVAVLPKGCGLSELKTTLPAESPNYATNHGVIVDIANEHYNPGIVTMVDNPFFDVWAYGDGTVTKTYNIASVFNVGDSLGNVDGILSYEMNNFGGGSYAFYPETSFATSTYSAVLNSALLKTLAARPATTLTSSTNKLTIATYNTENMGYDLLEKHLDDVAQSIVTNLKCPDILCLEEVQDNDGETISGTSAADQTLAGLISKISTYSLAAGAQKTYKALNIDPLLNSEGGAMGGNIRIVYLYQPGRVSFTQRGNAGSLDENYVLSDGSLALNPGRIAANNSAFNHSRRSLAVQFKFRGQRITLIGNHLKSKLGDGSLMGASQPVVLSTEAKRTEQAEILHDFSADLLKKDPTAKLLVMGDFNEFYASRPLVVLKGTIFNEMMEYLLPFAQRYSYVFNGNCQDIDHIFMSKSLESYSPEVDIPHFNSLFMNQVSDHDPVVARFTFP